VELLIPHSRVEFDEVAIAEVRSVLLSGRVATGEKVHQLEVELESRFHRPFACVTSGTAALHLTLLASGIGPGYRMAIPSFICPSVFYCLKYVGAEPVLYDCGHLGIGVSSESLEIAVADSDGCIIPHTFGFVTEFDRSLMTGRLCIEDCCQSNGAMADGHVVGNFGQASIHSFYATKMIGSADGGAVSGNAELLEWVRSRRNHRGHDDLTCRYPYSMSDLHAVLILARLEQLPRAIERRRQIAERYASELADLPIDTPAITSPSVWYRFPIITPVSREKLITEAFRRGIGFGFGVRTPLHRLLDRDPSCFPNAEKAMRNLVSVPIYPGLKETEQQQIVDVIRQVVKQS